MKAKLLQPLGGGRHSTEVEVEVDVDVEVASHPAAPGSIPRVPVFFHVVAGVNRRHLESGKAWICWSNHLVQVLKVVAASFFSLPIKMQQAIWEPVLLLSSLWSLMLKYIRVTNANMGLFSYESNMGSGIEPNRTASTLQSNGIQN